jgi:hypothetical protein
MKKYSTAHLFKQGLSGVVLLWAFLSCNAQTKPVNPNDLNAFEKAKDSITQHFDFFMTNRDYVSDKGITYYGGASFEADEKRLNELYKKNGNPEFIFPALALFKTHLITTKTTYTSPVVVNQDTTIAFCIKEEKIKDSVVFEILYYDRAHRPSRFGEEGMGRTDTIFKINDWVYLRNTEPDPDKIK